MDIIERSTRERAARFYAANPQIKNSILLDDYNERIICECGNYKFKLYKKHGGIVFAKGKRTKVVKDEPVRYTFVCKCGCRQVLKEDKFSYGKVTFACSAGKCPWQKTKMDRESLSCKYIIEK